jgi:SAM-dependent methyltransferase
MTDPELEPERIDHLRRVLDGASDSDDTPVVDPPVDRASGAIRTQARRGRNLLRRLLSRVRRSTAGFRGYDPRTVGRLSADLDGGMRSLDARFEQLRAEVRALAVWVGAEDPRNLGGRVDAVATNLELMKAELRGAERTLDELGRAIAPGAGLGAVAPRMAELRERVEALDRRVRQLGSAPASTTPPGTTAESPASVSPAPSTSPAPAGDTGSPLSSGSRFDYVGFEQRFRGDQAAVLATLRDRYLPHLRGNGPVLDLGCGRGELIRTLADEGIEGSGVDLDAGMVAEAVGAGTDAHHGDAVEFLRSQPEHSWGAITAIHVVEHLELDTLVELLELAATRLRPGGVFIAETPNPATLLVLGNSYILDPTHVWPLHPSLLGFLCERAGFRDVEFQYGSPADDYRLDLLPADGATAEVAAALNPSLERLNQVLFGPQEYAVIARTPPE